MKFNIIYTSDFARKVYTDAGGLTYATPGSCAVDVRACCEHPVTLAGQEQALIPLGFKIQLAPDQVSPEEDVRLGSLLLPRSGSGFKQGLVLGNTVGLIDQDYQGEVMAAVWHRPIFCSYEPLVIEPGDRIAQMIIFPAVIGVFTEVSEFPESDRGAGGFGSTGRQ